MPKQFFTRESAIEYLLSDQGFRDLYKRNPADLGTNQALRYANKLFDIESRGDSLRSIGELRGHTFLEHHKGRGRKPSTMGWQEEQKIPKGWFTYGQKNSRDHQIAVRVTSGERAAVKALQHDARDIRNKDYRDAMVDFLRHRERGRDFQVTINLTGNKRGQFTQVIQHGWSTDRLLYAAGYREDRHGNWKLQRGGQGLKNYLLELVNNMPKRSGDPSKWRGIRLYEIYLWKKPVDEKIDPAARTRPVNRLG